MNETIGPVTLTDANGGIKATCATCGMVTYIHPAKAWSAWAGDIVDAARTWAGLHPYRCHPE